jgi:hypothetical protein
VIETAGGRRNKCTGNISEMQVKGQPMEMRQGIKFASSNNDIILRYIIFPHQP